MLRVGAAYAAVAWVLIQVAQTVFPAFGLGATTVRLVIVVLVIGLLPVLIFAWAFEITPEGLKRESEVDRSESITPQTGKKLDRVIMGVLALGYFAVDNFVLAPQREQAATEAGRVEGRTESLVMSYGDKSIAVLPFVNMSADKDQEYFSEGISEELLPSSSANWRVSSPWYARSMINRQRRGRPHSVCINSRPAGASCTCPGESENVRAVRASAATI